MPARRILVVTYDFPPSPSVGGARWAAMTKYLARQGHQVVVVTSDVFGSEPPADIEGVWVVRPRTLESLTILRRTLRRRPIAANSTGITEPRLSLASRLLVPDGWVASWAPFARRATRRLLRNETFDCLVTTSPPESAHLVGLLLRSRPAWVADLRDGWSFESYRDPLPTNLQRTADRWLEQKVARSADIVVGATPPLAKDLEQRLGARARWVPNGWDPDLGFATSAPPPSRADDSAFRLVYTGKLTRPRGTTPEALFRAIKRVHAEPDIPPLRFVHAGPLTTAERTLMDHLGVRDLVENLGVIDRRHAVELQRSADALVLLTSRHTSEASAKLFEYLFAGRPILALAQNNEAERLVRDTGTGLTAPPDDVDAIADALRRIVRGQFDEQYAPGGLDDYAYPRVAAQMAEVIEEAIEGRSAAGARRD